MPFCFGWRISHFGAASKASSGICASVSLPCPVRRPAVTMGRACRLIRSFVTRPLVVPSFEFWRPGVLCWSPVRFTLQQLQSSHFSSTRSRWLLSGFLPPTADRFFIGVTSACSGPLSLWHSGWRLRSSAAAAGSRAGMDGRLSSPPSGVADSAVSCTLNALCINWNLFPVNPGLF